MNIQTYQILGFPLAQLSDKQFDKLTDEILTEKNQTRLITLNSEYVVYAHKNPDFKKIINSADILTIDGSGLIWAANFLDVASELSNRKNNKLASISDKHAFHLLFQRAFLIFKTGFELFLNLPPSRKFFPNRISGADFWLDICAKCEKAGLSVFLASRSNGLSDFSDVKNKLLQKFPDLKIAGDFTEQDLISKIQKAKPDVILFGFSMPHQDYLLAEILPKIKSARLGIGLGASFDFFAGNQKRAPIIFRKLGIEWLWRLITRPGRWRRIWAATGEFAGLMWKESGGLR